MPVPLPHRPSGHLIIANQTFQTDAPIVTWREPPYWDATRETCIPTLTDPTPSCTAVPYPRRYAVRPALAGVAAPALAAVAATIRQFVIHHDGCATSDMCFSVLHNERGLSVHFLIDNDGTIYQTLDLALMAYHAAAWNPHSIGVELCNRGDALRWPHYYDGGRLGPRRGSRACTINGHTFLAFDYTPAQLASLVQLSRALTRLLPNLPADYPQTSPGLQAWDTLPASRSLAFAGYLGHYHLTAQKWDPGWFDFRDHCRKLRGAISFPLVPTRSAPRSADRPTIPDDPTARAAATALLYELNERDAGGGFFPVGPWGEARLWHGGVHLAAAPRAPVFAPFAGRIVAARLAAPTAVGSVSFVLVRHEMSLGKVKLAFYSLYMHLADEREATTPAAWLAAWVAARRVDEIAMLDEPVEAGAVIGHVGTAGPGELARAQIHVEIFAASELFAELAGSPWQVLDGSAGGRSCELPAVLQLVDTNRDGRLAHAELADFYASGNGAGTHFWVTWHVSEWTAEPSWASALLVARDFAALRPAEVADLVAAQITPGLWWDQVAAHARLPPDGVVYHYHPISFVSWLAEQLRDAAGPTPDASAAREAPPGITDDLGDRAGTSMRSHGDGVHDACNEQLGLDQLRLGYDAPECTP